ncbi:prepilin-type N-terminal cleavage/methylation domain-containing protein [Gemmiger formicilis]|uniref:prepilin-type N-terminal cleavage/methylation domain-containing protein n=1 Tax=Gemmiger formicilis TaxID=745368 RepID=UPI003CCAECA0
MFKKLKDKKGFTLVELIVVLVILAILAALLIPALTGYIDKANYEKVIATTRTVVMAAQTETSEAYGKGTLPAAGLSASELTETDMGKNIGKLAEILNTKGDGYVNGITSAKVTVTVANGHVTTVEVKQGGYTCTYTKDSVPTTGDYIVGNYTVSKDKK